MEYNVVQLKIRKKNCMHQNQKKKKGGDEKLIKYSSNVRNKLSELIKGLNLNEKE